MIKRLSARDMSTIYRIINQAAQAYKAVIPDDCYHEPYMSRPELRREMAGMTFFGWEEVDEIVGVAGFQPVQDVTLIRHVYVLPGHQRRGIATHLVDHIKKMTATERLLAGTWADAHWAVDFYQNQGFNLMPNKDELLARYWDIPPRQIETSVVLGITLHRHSEVRSERTKQSNKELPCPRQEIK